MPAWVVWGGYAFVCLVWGAAYWVATHPPKARTRRVLELVRKKQGWTARELAAQYALDKYSVSRKLSVLLEGGFVRNGRPRKCQVTGKQSKTWFLV